MIHQLQTNTEPQPIKGRFKMETITKLKRVSEIMNNSSYSLTIGSFILTNSAIISFDLQASNKHLQSLKEMGIIIDFSSKIKSGMQNANDFVFKAKATPYDLMKIEKFSRDNHPYKISMINNHQIVEAGFPLKNMKIVEGRLSYGFEFPENKSLISHIEKIEAIRKEVRKKFKRETNTYTTRCAVKKLDY